PQEFAAPGTFEKLRRNYLFLQPPLIIKILRNVYS
ncbi:unnamed protein product, partial [Adineta steineri]